MDEQLFEIAYRFFKQLGIPVTFDTLKKQLLSHPEYPSLSALSEACNELHIEHVAIVTTFNELRETGFPVIAHFSEKGGAFVIVENIDTDKIRYYHPNKGIVNETIEQFQKQWSGVVFYAIADVNSGEEDYPVKRRQELLSKLKIPVLALSVAVLLGYSLYLVKSQCTNTFIGLLLIKMIGWFASLNLVLHAFGKSTKLTAKVCHAGKHTNCDDVLDSPASMILGLSMSDIGFVYFTGGLLSMLLSIYVNSMQPTVTFLLLISLCSIPYLFFSIYYQAFKVKKWCPLCLSVISVLLLEYLLFALSIRHQDFNIFNFNIIGFTVLSFSIAACTWALLKPLISEAKEGTQYQYKYLRLKKTPSIFNVQLDANPPVDMEFSDSDLIIGNPEAELSITCVVNTFCKPCAEAHKKIEKILKKYPDKVKLVIRFMVAEGRDKEALHLLEIYVEKRSCEFEKAIAEWFATKDYDLIKKQYPIGQIKPETRELLQQQGNWCKQLQLTYTPTIFLNNKQMGMEYTTDDIQWLVRNSLNS